MMNSPQHLNHRKDGKYCSYNLSEDKKSANLDIYDFIGDPWDGTTAKEVREWVGSLPESVEDIYVYINSPGGYVWDGLAIYNSLLSHPAKVHMTADAIVGSIATVIFMAGDERSLTEYADFFVHQAWKIAIGNADDMREAAEQLDRDTDKIVNIFVERAGIKEEEVRSLIKGEGKKDGTWLSGEEAVEKGFANEIYEANRAVAYAFDPSKIAGVPDHHIRRHKANQKRKEEKALRDAGASRRSAKKQLADQREAGMKEAASISFADKLKEISNQFGDK